MVEAEKLPSAVRTKMKHSDPWQATAMDEEAGCLDWAAKDGQKPAGNFDADYAALCRCVNHGDDTSPNRCCSNRRGTGHSIPVKQKG